MSFILDSRDGKIIHDGFENENRVTQITEKQKDKNKQRQDNESVEFC